jgi:hypothetical protein
LKSAKKIQIEYDKGKKRDSKKRELVYVWADGKLVQETLANEACRTRSEFFLHFSTVLLSDFWLLLRKDSPFLAQEYITAKYLLIDTPELKKESPYAKEAKNRTKELLKSCNVLTIFQFEACCVAVNIFLDFDRNFLVGSSFNLGLSWGLHLHYYLVFYFLRRHHSIK